MYIHRTSCTKFPRKKKEAYALTGGFYTWALMLVPMEPACPLQELGDKFSADCRSDIPENKNCKLINIERHKHKNKHKSRDTKQ